MLEILMDVDVKHWSTYRITAGTDLKSVLLNISSILFFVFPFFWYARPALGYHGIGACIGFYFIAYMMPPIGWRRPHPYSDDPTNVPYGHKPKIP